MSILLLSQICHIAHVKTFDNIDSDAMRISYLTLRYRKGLWKDDSLTAESLPFVFEYELITLLRFYQQYWSFSLFPNNGQVFCSFLPKVTSRKYLNMFQSFRSKIDYFEKTAQNLILLCCLKKNKFSVQFIKWNDVRLYNNSL